MAVGAAERAGVPAADVRAVRIHDRRLGAAAVAGLLVRHLGPTPIFPVSGALLALSMAYGLTQREFRDFGTGDKEMLSADKGLSQADA